MNEMPVIMKKLLPAVILLVVALVATAFTWNRLRLRIDPNVVEFNEDADRLIEGLQQYKEFVKSYPSGNLVEIAKALSGQSEKDRVLILATNRNKKNAKGEIVDPWGTPLQFYFAQNGVLIRSAGPNKIFEDAQVPGGDDLYRTEVAK
jgi:hypothetical protein